MARRAPAASSREQLLFRRLALLPTAGCKRFFRMPPRRVSRQEMVRRALTITERQLCSCHRARDFLRLLIIIFIFKIALKYP